MKLAFVSMLILLVSCGKDKLSSTSDSNSSSAIIYSGTKSCKMINGGNLSGCCSGHNGAKNCGTGLYEFTSAGNLVCNDGTISPTCVVNN